MLSHHLCILRCVSQKQTEIIRILLQPLNSVVIIVSQVRNSKMKAVLLFAVTVLIVVAVSLYLYYTLVLFIV